jgi:hypothetical protein
VTSPSPIYVLYVDQLLTAKQREQRMRTLATCEATVGIDMGRVRRLPPPDSLLITPAEAVRKRRRTSLGTLLKQAAKAGKNVKGAEVYPDRTVLQFGKPEPAEPENPWPLDEFRTKETKQ